MLAGIEMGSTKTVCAVCDSNLGLKGSVIFPTTTPNETMDEIVKYFKKFEIEAIGVGCFGPLDLNKTSPTYGYITNTYKAGWENFDVVGYLKEEFNVPIGFDTAVNGAVLGEAVKGAAKGCNNAIYIKVGNAIKVGAYVNGALMHGLIHPEGGHIPVKRHPDDSFEGACPFHKDCFDGMASGLAIEARWGKSPKLLVENEAIWKLEAYYIAQAVAIYILSYSPEKVILWGGVMHQEKMFDMIRQQVKKLLNGYIKHEMIDSRIDEYIVKPALGEDPGIVGSLCLAYKALLNK